MSMRINGFSGMDIDSMVKSMIDAKRVPMDKLTQQKTVLEWKRESYRELNSKMVDFKNKLSSYKYSTAMNSNQAVVSGNTTAVKANATASANSIPMSVEVIALAQKSYMQSGQGLKTLDNKDVTLKTTLAELAGQTAPIPDKYELNINGKKIEFDKTDNITNVINKINSEPGAKVTASFDELSGKFMIQSKEFGQANNIKDVNISDSFMKLIGIGAGQIHDATQATVKIKNTNDPNNESLKTFNLEDNSLLVNGVELTFQTINEGDPAIITTQTDPTKAMETIKGFVDTYNELIKTFSTKLGEEKYRSYAPLTAEQKKAMNENDIKLWEEKAKSGLLKNDDILRSAISEMRATIGEAMGDLSSIGITTGQYFENGKLIINEDKLKAALQSDPQKVSRIFQGSGDGVNAGIFSKVGEAMDNAVDKLVDKAGTSKFSTDANSILKEDSAMGRQLKDYNKRLDAMEERLKDLEIRYYRQFTAMETAMNKYNSQSSSLASYLQ